VEVIMKIDGTLPLPQLERLQAREGRSLRAGSGTDAAAELPTGPDVAVAGGARFVNEVRSLASVMSEFRGDEVLRAKQDIADGNLLTEIELDAAVDALLAGL
jgi:hypothetical protein